MAERRTHRLTYLALFLATVALAHQAHGAWRSVDEVCSVIWLLAWAVGVVRDIIDWRWHRG